MLVIKRGAKVTIELAARDAALFDDDAQGPEAYKMRRRIWDLAAIYGSDAAQDADEDAAIVEVYDRGGRLLACFRVLRDATAVQR